MLRSSLALLSLSFILTFLVILVRYAKRSSLVSKGISSTFSSLLYLKEYWGQYSVLMWIHIVTGYEKLCKINFKKLFFQNVLAFIDLFYRYHYPRYFIYSDCMWCHVRTTCTSMIFAQSTEKKLFFLETIFSIFSVDHDFY